MAACIRSHRKLNRDGYDHSGNVSWHRAAYEAVHGAIPAGLEIDHTCNNRWCLQVLHMEAVPHLVNVQRAVERTTHCRAGHERNDVNTRWDGKRRTCRICERVRQQRWATKREQVLA